MRTKKRLWLTGGILFFVILSNFFLPVRWIVAFILPEKQQESISGIWLYTTEHGEFQRGQEGLIVFSNSYERVTTGFDEYVKCHPTTPDNVLYRTFKLEPWQFWNWINYFIDPRWKYPYKDPSAIKAKLLTPPPSICPNYRSGPISY